jgi:hypothetical protein
MTVKNPATDKHTFDPPDLTGGRFTGHRQGYPIDDSLLDSYGRLTLIQRASMVIWGYSMAVWLYVIAMQLRYANSVYWPVAVWLPIRLDYFGEAGFMVSFLFAIIAVSVSVMKRRLRYG